MSDTTDSFTGRPAGVVFLIGSVMRTETRRLGRPAFCQRCGGRLWNQWFALCHHCRIADAEAAERYEADDSGTDRSLADALEQEDE